METTETNGMVPDVKDILKGEDLITFALFVDKRMEMKEAIKAMEASIKEIDERLTGIMAGEDHDKVQYGRYRVTIITKTNSRLDKEKLLSNGVSAGIIAASTVTSQSSYLEVRAAKEG